MTSRGRGGPRVPDGVPRPASLPFVRGPNRTDLAALPGTPGAPLPPNPSQPSPQFGQGDQFRRVLSQIPLERLNPNKPGMLQGGPTRFPNQPITSGLSQGAGPGPESLIPSPHDISNGSAARELMNWYPIIARLATLPNATNQTKILALKLRANLPVKPQFVPPLVGENGNNRPLGGNR